MSEDLVRKTRWHTEGHVVTATVTGYVQLRCLLKDVTEDRPCRAWIDRTWDDAAGDYVYEWGEGVCFVEEHVNEDPLAFIIELEDVEAPAPVGWWGWGDDGMVELDVCPIATIDRIKNA